MALISWVRRFCFLETDLLWLNHVHCSSSWLRLVSSQHPALSFPYRMSVRTNPARANANMLLNT